MNKVVRVAEKEDLYRASKAIRDNKILEMYKGGMTMAKIGEQLDISEATVSRVINKNKKSGI